MSRPSFAIGLAAAALVVASAAPVSAVTFDKLTYLTFNAPVQIPGNVLGAGTYRFHLMNADSGRNVIQVLSHDGSYVYSAFHTIPDYRSTVTEESTVTFMEAPVGVAPPVKSIFYGGETHGYAFLYPRGEPNLTPPVHLQPAISYAPLDTEPSIVAAVEPTVTAPPAFEPEPAPIVSEPVATSEPALPATASPLPLVGFGGFASLVLGLAVGLLRRHVG